MKKILFVLALCLLGALHVSSATSANLAADNDQPQVATLTFQFYEGPDGFMFICREAPNYQVDYIDLWVHNVNLDKNGYNEYGVTAWVQSQAGGEYSELVPGSLTPDSYVDISSIQVHTSTGPSYIFDYVFIGIDAR